MARPERPLFVYGTLRHADLFRAVLGHAPAPGTVRRAAASGVRAALIPGRTYPGLTAAPGRVIEGLVLIGLDKQDRARLDAFEGAEYRRGPILVRSSSAAVEAEAYWPIVTVPAEAPDWHYADWRAQHAATAVRAEREWPGSV